jgi:hypothetical protein
MIKIAYMSLAVMFAFVFNGCIPNPLLPSRYLARQTYITTYPNYQARGPEAHAPDKILYLANNFDYFQRDFDGNNLQDQFQAELKRVLERYGFVITDDIGQASIVVKISQTKVNEGLMPPLLCGMFRCYTYQNIFFTVTFSKKDSEAVKHYKAFQRDYMWGDLEPRYDNKNFIENITNKIAADINKFILNMDF